ncbi:MAG: Gfo/Idh/MocA family oxidoreductase [Paracoccaceae bacterium]
MKIGLVGAGWAARQHSNSIATIGGAEIVAVFDVDQGNGNALANDIGALAVDTLDNLLALDLDAVVVSTPSGAHREAVVPALMLGMAVFVEKPVSRSMEDALAIADAAERSGAVCAVGYQWRALDNLGPVHDDLQVAKPALMVSQGVGITQARSWFNDDRLSGGLIFERVSHHIDLQRMIAGEVASVSAVRGGVALSGRVASAGALDDVLSLTLRFTSGAIGVISVGWTPEDYPPTQSLALHTTGSSFDIALDPDFTVADRSGANIPRTVIEHPFTRQMRSFLGAARNKAPALVHCTARDAAGTVAVCLAAASSLGKSGQQANVKLQGHADEET